MAHESVIFVLDQQRYALPSGSVRELARAVQIIPVPNAPEQVEGVIDYRGKIVPVLDLRRYLGLAPRALLPTDHFMIFQVHRRIFAARLDRALDVATVATSEDGEVMVGHDASKIVHVPDGTVIVLSVNHLIAELERDMGQSAPNPNRLL